MDQLKVEDQQFRLGINYWPAMSAMYWWQRFDPQEVDMDFLRIRESGFDSARIFLLWEDFQPAPDHISQESLARLVRVANAAARHELKLIITLFTGHMSGVNWIPRWAVDKKKEVARFRVISGGKVHSTKLKNWYSDLSIIKAQALLAREVATALKDHPALWAWDLGNENSNCVIPPSRDAAIAWLETMAGAIRSIDSAHPITIGLHMEDLEEDRRLGPAEAARVCDFLCMHGYPLYADWAESPTDEMLLVFLGLITRWLGGKEVLFEEFGAPAISRFDAYAQALATRSPVPLLDAEDAATFMHRALTALHRFGFLGAMVWCFADYSPLLYHNPPLDEAVHERYFGLWRASYVGKPALAEIKSFAGIKRGDADQDLSWIDLNQADFYLNPRENLRRLYARFRQRYVNQDAEANYLGKASRFP